jgi:hypothetical protein
VGVDRGADLGSFAICVECFVTFPISKEMADWVENGDGVRVQCPDCYHKATGVDDFNDD